MRTTPSLFNSPGPLLATRKQYLEVKWVSRYVKEGWWVERAVVAPDPGEKIRKSLKSSTEAA